MLHHSAQARRGTPDRVEHAVDKDSLAVKDVHGRIGHLAMHAKRQADLGHFFQDPAHPVEIGDAAGRICGGTGRIKFDRFDQLRCMSRGDVFGIRILGQIKRHQWLKIGAVGQGGQDTVAIGGSLGAGDHRGHQIGHDDGA